MDEETVEFNVAHNRKYSTDHLWYQEKDERLMIGVSEFLRLEIGDILEVKLRVCLPISMFKLSRFRKFKIQNFH